MDYTELRQMAQNQTANYRGPTAESASQIRDGISQSEQLLSDMQGLIDTFEKRVETILRPVPPQGLGQAATPAAPQHPASHLRGRITIMNEGFSHVMSRLAGLMDRIEL